MSYEETSDWDSVPEDDIEYTFCYAFFGFPDMTEEEGRKIAQLLEEGSSELHWKDSEIGEIMLSLPWRSIACNTYVPGKDAKYGVVWDENGDERDTLDVLDTAYYEDLDFDSPYGHVSVTLGSMGVEVNDDDDDDEDEDEDW